MRVLITGNTGYVGGPVTRFLKKHIKHIDIIGYDLGFFAHSLTGADNIPEVLLTHQYYDDVRNFNSNVLEGVDAVIHLAAVSNDPMGNEFEAVTEEINHKASVNIAQMAADVGVKNFVFASSCSIYGQTSAEPRKETDPTNPLTAYAKSKINSEIDIKNINLKNMIFTSLRFATACGMSDRLRLDLVLNDFVACAMTTGNISILSDGSPWRPLIDVEDMARAILWATTRNVADGGQYLTINAGNNENNYQIKELAAMVAHHIPGTTVHFDKNAAPDKRSYKVDFSLYKDLAPKFIPQISLDESILRLKNGFTKMKFTDSNFRGSPYMRLNTLRKHISSGLIDLNLKWIGKQ